MTFLVDADFEALLVFLGFFEDFEECFDFLPDFEDESEPHFLEEWTR